MVGSALFVLKRDQTGQGGEGTSSAASHPGRTQKDQRGRSVSFPGIPMHTEPRYRLTLPRASRGKELRPTTSKEEPHSAGSKECPAKDEGICGYRFTRIHLVNWRSSLIESYVFLPSRPGRSGWTPSWHRRPVQSATGLMTRYEDTGNRESGSGPAQKDVSLVFRVEMQVNRVKWLG